MLFIDFLDKDKKGSICKVEKMATLEKANNYGHCATDTQYKMFKLVAS